jgi:hypothetical protein
MPAPLAVQRNLRLSARNSGLFYLRATEQSLSMMKRLTHRMAHEDVWDQTAYNEEQFYLSYGAYRNPGVSQRVMNYLCFMNRYELLSFFKRGRSENELSVGLNASPMVILMRSTRTAPSTWSVHTLRLS